MTRSTKSCGLVLACLAVASLTASGLEAQRRGVPMRPAPRTPAPVRATPRKAAMPVQRANTTRLRTTVVRTDDPETRQRPGLGGSRDKRRTEPLTAAGGGRAGRGLLTQAGMCPTPQRRTGDPEIDKALDFRRTRVKGSKLRKNVDRVRKSLKWHRDLSAAQDEAAVGGKPILWIQTLGHLDGYL